MRTAVKAFLLLLAMLLQTTIAEQLKIFGIKPDIFLIVFVALVTSSNWIEALSFGFIAGSIMDMLWGRVYGLNALYYTYLAAVCTIINQRVYRRTYGLIILLTLMATLTYELFMFLLSFAMWGDTRIFPALISIILPQCLYNALAAVPLFWLIKRIVRE